MDKFTKLLGQELATNKSLSAIDNAVSKRQPLFEDYLSKYEKPFLNVINKLIGANDSETKHEYFKWLDFDYLNKINKETVAAAKDFKAKGLNNLLVVGMGGSGINTLVLKNALYDSNPAINHSYVNTQNNLDPSSLLAKLSYLKTQNLLERTVFCFISKSGGTDEVKRNIHIIFDYLEDVLGSYIKAINLFASNSVVITENNPENFLNQLCHEVYEKTGINIRQIEHHNEVGGRFSMFSPVGMFPAEMMNLSSNQMLIGAEACFKDLIQNKDLKSSNIGKLVLLDLMLSQNNYTNRYSMVYSDSLEALNKFRAQLRGESLNKKGIDTLIHIPGVGTVNHHSDLELLFKDDNGVLLEQIVFAKAFKDHTNSNTELKCMSKIEGESNYESLINNHVLPIFEYLNSNGHPTILTVIDKQNEESLAYYLMKDMLATVIQAGLQDRLDDSIRQHEVEKYKSQVKKQANNQDNIQK